MNNLKFFLFLVYTLMTFSNTYGQQSKLSLIDFYSYNPEIEHQVDIIFSKLNDTTRVAQMIVTSAGELGKPDNFVLELAKKNKIGGVVFLKGAKENHKHLIDSLNNISVSRNQVPLLFSIDAEPSLINGRLEGVNPIMQTIDIKTIKQANSVALEINTELLKLGFRQNFAPVCDISPKNEAIKNRSFGSDREKVVQLSKAFIQTTQAQGIIATAKHFPGHGLVEGDTHKQSVYINGELKELDVYPRLIDAGVISIMTSHLTIINNEKYNTNNLPVSCSRNIVTDLLIEELGFKGLIITDALNIMKAVTIIDNAPLLASKAGNDMLLMPIDETITIYSILTEMYNDSIYKQQVYKSVKKIIRLKLFLGLIQS